MGILMLKIRRSWDRLTFNIPILVRRQLYIDTVPWLVKHSKITFRQFPRQEKCIYHVWKCKQDRINWRNPNPDTFDLKTYCYLTHWSRDKMTTILQTIYLNAFAWMEILEFQLNFIEICSLWLNWQCTIIDSDNGLVPNRRQAIVWSSNGGFYWRIYASFVLSELTNKFGSIIKPRMSG